MPLTPKDEVEPFQDEADVSGWHRLNSITRAMNRLSSFAILIAYGGGVHIMPAAVKAPERKSTRANPEDDDIATGIIKGLKDFKDGRFTRLKNAEDLEEHFRSL